MENIIFEISKNSIIFFLVFKVRSLINEKLSPEILDNFNPQNKNIVISDAIQSVKRISDRSNNEIKGFKDQRKLLNLYDFEYSYRISFALACLVLFFIGAPIGSIIRKGGFGLPMLIAIFIFVIYFFVIEQSLHQHDKRILLVVKKRLIKNL